MIRHWNRNLRATTDVSARRHMMRSRAINTVGAVVTAVVLVIVLVSKFADGAWIAVAAMAVIWLTMYGISRHYASVEVELTQTGDAGLTLPASNRSIVLVSKLHLPTLRALAYARATRPSQLEAVTIDVDEADTLRLKEEWDRSGMPLPLTVISSPYREITRPVVDYVNRLRRESPRDIVTVYIPEYVLGHWWEQVLHNHSALRLKSRLLQQRGVVVASVPYQLSSATRSLAAAASPDQPLTGSPRQAAATRVPSAAPEAARVVAAAAGDAGRQQSGRRRAVPQWMASPLRELATARETLQARELQAEMSDVTGVRAVTTTPIADIPDRQLVHIAGILRTVTLRPRGTSLTMEAELWDGTGNVTLIWLGRRHIAGIQPGRRILIHGRSAWVNGERTIFNPAYELRSLAED